MSDLIITQMDRSFYNPLIDTAVLGVHKKFNEVYFNMDSHAIYKYRYRGKLFTLNSSISFKKIRYTTLTQEQKLKLHPYLNTVVKLEDEKKRVLRLLRKLSKDLKTSCPGTTHMVLGYLPPNIFPQWEDARLSYKTSIADNNYTVDSKALKNLLEMLNTRMLKSLLEV